MHGFRTLMSGAALDDFKANPIMLYQHNRSVQYGDQDSILPIGKWVDIEVQGDKLVAYPEFDDDDDFAKRIEKKVEKGYLNGASIWLHPMAVSDEDTLKLPGQSGPTVTKWGVLEASIVDIPNCKNALAIRNGAGEKVLLSGDAKNADVLTYLKSLLPNTHTNTMDKKLLAVRLGLPEDASEAQISEKLTALLSQDAAKLALKQENDTLKAEIVRLKAEAQAQKVADLVEGAIREGKLAAGEKDHYVKLATADYDTVSALLTAKPVIKSIEQQLTTGAANPAQKDELAELVKLSGTDLYMQGKLEALKAISEDHFKLKYKEAFGIEWKG
jgi:hypothetical protein